MNPRGKHIRTHLIAAVKDKDTKRCHGQVREKKCLLVTDVFFFVPLGALLCGYVPPDLELVFGTAPVLSVKKNQANGNFLFIIFP